MTHQSKTQLTLTIIILVLTAAGLLYGWIYASSLQNKFQTLVLAPKSAENETILALKQANSELFSKVDGLQQELVLLKDQLTHSANASSSTKPITEIDHPDKKEIYLDGKCFEDKNNLNECTVFASIDLSNGFRLLIKPVGQIKEDINEVSFEFYDQDNKYTDLKITTTNLFNTNIPIASLVFLRKYDITLQTSIGLNSTNAVYNFDGSGWIDLTKY